ncbi:alpha/beta fold hydrolase [Kribbella sp. NBC_01245]|uniref:bifunctional 3-oxoadipate enol-lactonase/4-carboxymuconolactone decarboxylase PcaDC n=1 Tax=Kribbella sp. NBC_01245 TaxID=2903578 RepID=UPI002E27E8CC|nr:alpha/beta fold hydrolase [Kribbella sp. NBC_01245]
MTSWSEEGPRDAQPLVLLNSIGSSTEIWTPCLGPLAEQFRVIRIDLPGHGTAPAGPFTIESFGEQVVAILDELGITRAHLAGISLGGMIGQWLAANHPARVARLALICTSAWLPPATKWLDRAAVVRAAGLEAIADTVLNVWTMPSSAATVSARRPASDRLRKMLLAVDPESYANCCEAIAATDLRPELPRIAARTLILYGENDPATPRPHAEALADGISGSRLEAIPDAAHIPTIDQPGLVASYLLDHFREGGTLAKGYETRRAVLGDAHVDRARTTGFGAPFQEFITRYAWGDVWSRPGLSRRERSIATLAALVTLGADHELAMHVRAAQRNGLTADEIAELLLHTSLYAGLPRANRALAIARETLTD